MNGLAAFVDNAVYPLPYNMFGGMGDYVPIVNGFPLPYNAFTGQVPYGGGSLPKSPSLPRALIGNGGNPMTAGRSYAATADGGGCGSCGCGGGMGALCPSCSPSMTSDTLIPQASLPTFLQGDSYISGVPTVYLGIGVLIAAFAFMGGSKGRRR